MGISINVHQYKVGQLLNDIEAYVAENGGYREGSLPVREWFTKVAPAFGFIAGDKFYVLWNEYYEDYNAGTSFLSAVDKYYFPNRDEDDDFDTFWSSNYKTVCEGANEDDILEELFPEEFGYEGTFTSE